MNNDLKQRVILIGLLLCIAAFGVYKYFEGRRYVIKLTESEIQSKLSERLPIRRGHFLLVAVTLDKPRVELVNGTNSIAAGLDVTLQVLGMPFQGSIDVSGGVRYVSEKGEFYLSDPVVNKFSVHHVPEQHMAKVNEALRLALQEYYADHPIYTLSTLSLKQGLARLILKGVIIENEELVITLGV